jgi:hypothetical protein
MTMDDSLLRLPPEIRNAIYELTLVADERIRIGHKDNEWPALLKTCRQINSEAVSIYLLGNTFICALKSRRSDDSLEWEDRYANDLHRRMAERSDRNAAFLSWFRDVAAVDRSVVCKMRLVIVDLWAFLLEEDSQPYNTRCSIFQRWRPNFGYWNNIVENIKASGLQRSQIRSTGLKTSPSVM